MRASIRSWTAGSSVRAVPRSSTRSGMTLKASLSVRKLVTEITAGFSGSALRATIDCSASTICAGGDHRVDGVVRLRGMAAAAGDVDREDVGGGHASAPGRMAKSPTGSPGMLCMP